MKKFYLNKLLLVLAAVVVSFFNVIPVSAVSDFYSDSNIQFYDPTACDPNGGGGDSPPASSVASAEGPVYMVGDSITEMSKSKLESEFSKANLEVSKINADVGRAITRDTVGSDPSGIEAVNNDENKIKNSKTVVIALGTNSSGGVDNLDRDIPKLINEIKNANSSAKIYWVNIFSPGVPDKDSLNSKIKSKASSEGYTVIDADKESIAVGSDQIHPTASGINKFAKVVVGGLEVSGSGASTPPSSGTSGSGNTIACCPTGDAAGALSGSDNEAKVWNYFIAKGLSPKQVAGIMGNMSQESGFDPQKVQGGSRSKTPASVGWGLIQWTPGTKIVGLADQANIDGPIYELQTQLDLVWQHMNNNPVVTKPFSLSDFKKINDVEEATLYFEDKIEGAGIPAMADRFAAAKAALRKYGSGASTTTSSSDSGGGCTGAAGSSGSCSINEPVYGSVHGSGNEYTQTQLTRLFGSPGTASSHPDMDKNLTTVDFNGNSVSVNKKAAGCLKAVAADIKSRALSYKINQMGCYRYDSDNGSTNIGLKSYHTYGVACDINWDKNPFVAGGTADYNIPREYVDAFHDHGWTWGGNWVSVKDYMHFEFNGIKP